MVGAMRRLLRILFNAATVMSLVFCVAMVALWVRSYWITDVMVRHAAEAQRGLYLGTALSVLRIVSERGRLRVAGVQESSEYPLVGPPVTSWTWGHEVRLRVGFVKETSIYHETPLT